MHKHILLIGGIAAAGAATAQSDSAVVQQARHDSLQFITDTTAYQPDSVQGIAFTRQQIDEIERASTAAARAREERASARASARTAADEPTASTSSGSVKRTHGGAKLSLDRMTDPNGRKHWRRMNRRSTRLAPDSPPGTVPVY